MQSDRVETQFVTGPTDIPIRLGRSGIVREGDAQVDPIFVPNATDQLFKRPSVRR